MINHLLNSQPLSIAAAGTPTPPSPPVQENIHPNVKSEEHRKNCTLEKATKKSKKSKKTPIDGKEDNDEDDIDKTRWSDTQVVQLIYF